MVTGPGFPRRGLFLGATMTEAEFEQRLKALQQEVSEAYLKGYCEARQRAQWNLTAALDEATRLRNALEFALDEVQDPDRRAQILIAMRRRTESDQE